MGPYKYDKADKFIRYVQPLYHCRADLVLNNLSAFLSYINGNNEILEFITKGGNNAFNAGKEAERVLSSYGSVRFDLGNDVNHAMLNTYKLLTYISDNKIPVDYLGASYTQSKKTEDRTEAFAEKIIYPFAEYIRSYISSNDGINMNRKNKIFIVHGHDNEAKLEMARTLEKGGFEAVILHEQASYGETIIEKIETYTDVAFAVVLYTPCDMGRSKDAPVSDEKKRARQNVVFEHGYLIGKLGRNRVCALVKGDIEIPGDISGVIYITMDNAGAWKMALASEMKHAGLQVDMNKFCS